MNNSKETRNASLAFWHCEIDSVAITINNSKVIITASEIIGAEFKNRLEVRGCKINKKPSDVLNEITFNRFPLQTILCVAPPSNKSASQASCWIELSDADTIIKLFDFPTHDDQILHDRKWFSLISDEIKDIKQSLAIASVQKLGLLTLRQYLNLLRQERSFIKVKSSSAIKCNIKDNSFSISTPSLTDEFKGNLYSYQRTGVNWMNSIAKEDLGCILADEMGLGKTIQVIAFIFSEVQNRREPSLIVAPATLLENWRREFYKFTPSLNVVIHRGYSRTGFPSKLSKYQIIITSYDTAVRDLSLLKMISWNAVILDEAQAIKNPKTSRAMALKQLQRRVAIAVTGTPIENTVVDLWSIIDFSCPNLLGTLNDFEKRYFDDIQSAELLEPIITPLILRRLVKEVANDLPARIDIDQPVELSRESIDKYENIRNEILKEYGKSASLVSLTKLRIFCTHPFLLEFRDTDPSHYSEKYVRLLEILDEIFLSNHKTLIFTSYTAMADILKKDLLRRYSVYIDIIDGRTPVEQRQPAVDKFQDHPSAAALILNPRAAGTGLNITAANHVIHYNLEWNPAVEDQATARAYRRGQTQPVTVHKLFHPGTVEEIIYDRILRKRLISEKAVVGVQGDSDDLTDIARALEISPKIENGDNDA